MCQAPCRPGLQVARQQQAAAAYAWAWWSAMCLENVAGQLASVLNRPPWLTRGHVFSGSALSLPAGGESTASGGGASLGAAKRRGWRMWLGSQLLY